MLSRLYDKDAEKNLRVFVCFSSREEIVADFVRLLWIRLQAQPLRVFNYETRDGEIPAGSSIEETCKQEIENSHFFFAVISDESIKSSWVKMEVEHAIILNRKNFIFPIILTSSTSWDGPLEKLNGLKSLLRISELELSKSRVELIVENIVRDFCFNREIQYFPLDSDIDRLPLRRRLFEELIGNRSLKNHRKAQQIQDLFEDCDEFVLSYKDGDLEEASNILSAMLRKIRKNFSEVDIYYPRVVESIIEVKKSNDNPISLQEILNKLQRLEQEQNKWKDANVFGMLGYISLLLDRPAAALNYYGEAERYLTTKDPALYHNKLLAAILVDDRGEIGAICQLLRTFEQGMLVSNPGDLVRIKLIQSIALSALGQTDAAFDILDELEEIREEDFDLIRQLFDISNSLAVKAKDSHIAYRLKELMFALEEVIKHFSPLTQVSIKQRRAWLLYELGDIQAAAMQFEHILENTDFKHSVKLLIEAALVFLDANKHSRSLSCLTYALSERNYEMQIPRVSKIEFEYYLGLAAWLNGEEEVAQECYRRSGNGDAGKWYSNESWWRLAKEELSKHIVR